MAKRGCELCSNPARMFCESDQASLCWGCDEKVHAANFLVAKHSRTLLCHVCSAPTPWTAAGLRLGPTISVCHGCAAGESEDRGAGGDGAEDEEDGGYDSQESESDDGEYYSDSEGFSEEEDEEEDGENQVVPWSDSVSSSPPAASYSVCVENVSLSSMKRTRDYGFESEDEDGCCSSENPDINLRKSDESYSSSSSLLRPLKMRRRSNDGSPLDQAAEEHAPSSSGTAAIVEKLRRFQQKVETGEGENKQFTRD